MFHWLRELLELKYEFRERRAKCESCEVLKHQLAVSYIEREKLLNKILNPVVPIIEERKEEEPKVIRPHIPWNVQRQIIEKEDREKAKLMREAPKPKSVEELEKEILDASKAKS